jgi:MraZ protein
MFSGGYNNSIDSKGRAIVPAKFRQALGSDCKLVRGIDNCLFLFPVEQWRAYKAAHIDSRPEEDPKARRLKRLFNYNSIDIVVDTQGRINIPQDYRDTAGIVKEMVNIGNSDRIEIWSKERFEEEMNPSEESLGDLLSSMQPYAV